MIIQKANSSLKGELTVPGDKSISHRAVMFGALANGTTRIRNFLPGADCLSTISCFEKMGISINRTESDVIVFGKGLHGLQPPVGELDCGNSGTTMRLISGILAGQSFDSVLTGDESIRTRPMNRVIRPLTEMGASIISRNGNGCAPLEISGRTLHGITYKSPVASAQVKSCVLLAGLYASSPTSVIEPALSRDHTERMLASFGVQVKQDGLIAEISPGQDLTASDILVPGDISSAAYFLCAALMLPGSAIRLTNIGVNPTRTGILQVLKKMGANIRQENLSFSGGEPSCDLIVSSADLHGCVIEGDLIPTLIDEIPILAVLACYAEGETIIRDAAELRVKESDRIAIMTENLQRMGADITATEDGMIIHGGRTLHGAVIDSCKDHRVAMSFAIAALLADGETEIRDSSCVRISYPNFYDDLFGLLQS